MGFFDSKDEVDERIDGLIKDVVDCSDYKFTSPLLIDLKNEIIFMTRRGELELAEDYINDYKEYIEHHDLLYSLRKYGELKDNNQDFERINEVLLEYPPTTSEPLMHALSKSDNEAIIDFVLDEKYAQGICGLVRRNTHYDDSGKLLIDDFKDSYKRAELIVESLNNLKECDKDIYKLFGNFLNASSEKVKSFATIIKYDGHLGDDIKEFSKNISKLNKVHSKKLNRFLNDNYEALLPIVSVNELRREKDCLEDSLNFINRACDVIKTADNSNVLECTQIDIRDNIVRDLLGQGAGGKTFKIYSPELKKERVLKLIDPSQVNPKESELMGKLEGANLENIVQVYDAGYNIASMVELKTHLKAPKQMYAIIMEYLDGDKLTDVINDRLTEDKVLKYSVQIYNGIKSLREHGIFHRDLRPDNIIVMKDYVVKKNWNEEIAKKDVVKIIDLGIATDKPEADPKDNRRYGGPNDMFSLGMITYKMATKKHLIKTREEDMNEDSYANTIKELKKEAFDKSGLKDKYKQKIRTNVSKKVGDIILGCFEEKQPINNLEKLYVDAKEDLKYYFMDKEDLIMELELMKIYEGYED